MTENIMVKHIRECDDKSSIFGVIKFLCTLPLAIVVYIIMRLFGGLNGLVSGLVILILIGLVLVPFIIARSCFSSLKNSFESDLVQIDELKTQNGRLNIQQEMMCLNLSINKLQKEEQRTIVLIGVFFFMGMETLIIPLAYQLVILSKWRKEYENAINQCRIMTMNYQQLMIN